MERHLRMTRHGDGIHDIGFGRRFAYVYLAFDWEVTMRQFCQQLDHWTGDGPSGGRP